MDAGSATQRRRAPQRQDRPFSRLLRIEGMCVRTAGRTTRVVLSGGWIWCRSSSWVTTQQEGATARWRDEAPSFMDRFCCGRGRLLGASDGPLHGHRDDRRPMRLPVPPMTPDGRGNRIGPELGSYLAISKPGPELSRIGSREAQYVKLCAEKRADTFFKRVCGNRPPPPIGVGRPNIPDLLGPCPASGSIRTGPSHCRATRRRSSRSASPRSIQRSSCFPRVPDTLERPKELIAAGFVRGEQFVEVVSRDLETKEPRFYLVSFEQDCNYKGGCDLASLLTEEIEHKWTAYSIYSDQDLEKTSFDCHACHQPGGSAPKTFCACRRLPAPGCTGSPSASYTAPIPIASSPRNSRRSTTWMRSTVESR